MKELKPCTCGCKYMHSYWNKDNEVVCQCTECKKLATGETINEAEKNWNKSVEDEDK